MTTVTNPISVGTYGVLVQDSPASDLDEVADQVRRLGYAILDAGYTADEIKQISEAFNWLHASYLKKYGEARLRSANEFHTTWALLKHGDPVFVLLATNQHLLNLLGNLINGKFILNQQNGVIIPPGETYNQGAWHRYLPYRHYICNTPLAVNAFFCLNDFTLENASTFVFPATHQSVNYPSASYIQRNAIQVKERADQYILLDCMVFHSGGFNRTNVARRAVNHSYTIPYFKQQIRLPELLRNVHLNSDQMELFGFGFEEPNSIDSYLTKQTR